MSSNWSQYVLGPPSQYEGFSDMMFELEMDVDPKAQHISLNRQSTAHEEAFEHIPSESCASSPTILSSPSSGPLSSFSEGGYIKVSRKDDNIASVKVLPSTDNTTTTTQGTSEFRQCRCQYQCQHRASSRNVADKERGETASSMLPASVLPELVLPATVTPDLTSTTHMTRPSGVHSSSTGENSIGTRGESAPERPATPRTRRFQDGLLAMLSLIPLDRYPSEGLDTDVDDDDDDDYDDDDDAAATAVAESEIHGAATGEGRDDHRSGYNPKSKSGDWYSPDEEEGDDDQDTYEYGLGINMSSSIRIRIGMGIMMSVASKSRP